MKHECKQVLTAKWIMYKSTARRKNQRRPTSNQDTDNMENHPFQVIDMNSLIIVEFDPVFIAQLCRQSSSAYIWITIFRTKLVFPCREMGFVKLIVEEFGSKQKYRYTLEIALEDNQDNFDKKPSITFRDWDVLTRNVWAVGHLNVN